MHPIGCPRARDPHESADSVPARLASCAVASLPAQVRRATPPPAVVSGDVMSDAIVVVNAGSSSIKFSLFVEHIAELELDVHGQVESIYTAPHFVAKNQHGDVICEETWAEGTKLGHEGALDHIVTFLRSQLGSDRLFAVW